MNRSGTVLVVDDNAPLAENIAEVLQASDFRSEVADCADSALARLRQGGISAVVTDYRMPGRNGAELLAQMRREGFSVPVVVMSAYTDAGTRDASEEAGAVRVLPKPLDLPALLQTLEGLAETLDVLIVDDDRAFAENLAEILAELGLSLAVGASAGEALAQARRPRAAVLDFRLPDRSGVELARRLSARWPNVQILFVTASPAELTPALGEPPSAPHLGKPVDVERLVAWARTTVPHDAGGQPPRDP